MEESKRQKQVARLIQEELSDILLKEGLNTLMGGMVSISKVVVTPDLLEARVYLSLLNIDDPAALMALFKAKAGSLRGLLGHKVRHQLRRIPEVQFILDDTLDHVFRMEALFKKINEEKK